MVHEFCPHVCSTPRSRSRVEMLRVSGNGAQGLRCRPEQDVVHHGLVLERDDPRLRGTVNTTWNTARQAVRVTILQHCARAKPWHLGQLRFRHESYAMRWWPQSSHVRHGRRRCVRQLSIASIARRCRGGQRRAMLIAESQAESGGTRPATSSPLARHDPPSGGTRPARSVYQLAMRPVG